GIEHAGLMDEEEPGGGGAGGDERYDDEYNQRIARLLRRRHLRKDDRSVGQSQHFGRLKLNGECAATFLFVAAHDIERRGDRRLIWAGDFEDVFGADFQPTRM